MALNILEKLCAEVTNNLSNRKEGRDVATKQAVPRLHEERPNVAEFLSTLRAQLRSKTRRYTNDTGTGSNERP